MGFERIGQYIKGWLKWVRAVVELMADIGRLRGLYRMREGYFLFATLGDRLSGMPSHTRKKDKGEGKIF